MSTKGQELRTK